MQFSSEVHMIIMIDQLFIYNETSKQFFCILYNNIFKNEYKKAFLSSYQFVIIKFVTSSSSMRWYWFMGSSIFCN